MKDKLGKIRFISNGNNIEKESSYCFDKNENTVFYSLSCHKRECYSTTVIKKFPLSKPLSASSMGNPSFILCHELSGIPVIAEYWNSYEWIEQGICMFRDNDFIGTEYLLYLAIRQYDNKLNKNK